MDEKKYRLPGRASLSLPVDDADRLLRLADGDSALLYLHILRSGGSLIPSYAAQALGRTEEEVLAAAARLDSAGLLTSETERLPAPPDEPPGPTPGEIARRGAEESEFRLLVSETQRLLGRTLSGADIQILFRIYDGMRLPTEVLLVLINFCQIRKKIRYGEGRLPSMNEIRKEAARWAEREIFTIEAAEAHVAQLELAESEAEQIRRALQLGGRSLSASEREYIESWVRMGYRKDAILLAYDRTVLNTGKLSWTYMDRIIRSWYEKQLFTPAEIERGDVRAGGRKRPGRASSGGGGTERTLDDTDRDFDEIINRKG